jgi:exosome complex component RRP42
MAVSGNIFFDPSASELAVADSVLAVSVTRGEGAGVRVVAIRTVETMARGAGGGSGVGGVGGVGKGGEEGGEEGVWRPPRGGMKRGLVSRVVKMVCERGGVGEEVLDGLEGLDGG